MIALQIVPLVWADPDSRKVLIHDDAKPSERFTGEDGDGFYSVVQARMQWEEALTESSVWRHWLATNVAPSDLPLYTTACVGSQLVGVYIEHFSAPADYSDHFVETPLLSLPDVPEDAYDPDTHGWKVGDWFLVTEFVYGTADAERGKGPFQVSGLCLGGDVWADEDVLYLAEQIRPCPAPESTTDTQSTRTELPCPGSAGGTVTIPSQEALGD